MAARRPMKRRRPARGLAALKRKLYRGAIVAAVAVALVAIAFSIRGDRLWRAIVQVESSGNPRARNPATDAVGIAQITKTLVDDCNRIVGYKRFSYADRWNVRASREMFDIYLRFWGREYEKETGNRCTDEIRARMWNGGPKGYRLKDTAAYWNLVKKHL